MQLLLKFDIKADKEDISADFWNAHNSSWINTKKPTNTEFKNSIKNEINSWLEDLEIDFKMQELPAFITQTEAFNAVIEGMKILDWDKNHGTV